MTILPEVLFVQAVHARMFKADPPRLLALACGDTEDETRVKAEEVVREIQAETPCVVETAPAVRYFSPERSARGQSATNILASRVAGLRQALRDTAEHGDEAVRQIVHAHLRDDAASTKELREVADIDLATIEERLEAVFASWRRTALFHVQHACDNRVEHALQAIADIAALGDREARFAALAVLLERDRDQKQIIADIASERAT